MACTQISDTVEKGDWLTQPPVFSKCAESIEGGKRLENLSWRLWNRETFCCQAKSKRQARPSTIAASDEVPILSSSVASTESGDSSSAADLDYESPSEHDRPAQGRSRCNEKHLTSLGLEKMICDIKEKSELEPLPPSVSLHLSPITQPIPQPLPESPRMESLPNQASAPLHHSTDSCRSATTVDQSQKIDDRGSDTSVSSGGLIKSGSIVHGFCPSPFSSSMRAKAIPEPLIPPSASPSAHPDAAMIKKKAGMFTLGGSSGDEESSFEDRMGKRFMPGSLNGRLKQSGTASRPNSFKAMLPSRRVRPISERQDEDEAAIETDDEEEEDEEEAEEDDEDEEEDEEDADDNDVEDEEVIDESAIDEEDDDSAWEDSVAESSKSSVVEDKPDFKRVDSRPNLVSRKSLLTRGLHEPQRAAALAEAAMRSSATLCRSRTASPNGPSVAASLTQEDVDSGLPNTKADVTRPKPITSSSSRPHQLASSPRTNRRNMLATELTESLRRHLLWERQQKSTTFNAVKRRHTAHKELTNLQEYPTLRAGQEIAEATKTSSWSQHFDYEPSEYYNKGW